MAKKIEQDELELLQKVLEFIKKLEKEFNVPNSQLIFHHNGIDMILKSGTHIIKSGTPTDLNNTLIGLQ